jgi:hypothetical protein
MIKTPTSLVPLGKLVAANPGNFAEYRAWLSDVLGWWQKHMYRGNDNFRGHKLSKLCNCVKQVILHADRVGISHQLLPPCPRLYPYETEDVLRYLRMNMDVCESIAQELEEGSKLDDGEKNGGNSKKPKTRRKRSDPKEDKLFAEAWATGQYRTYKALAKEKNTTTREVKLAIDRHRKRQAAKKANPHQ